MTMSTEELQKRLRADGIRYVLAQFVDIHGAAKAKSVPVDHLGMILNEGAGFAGFALWGFGTGPHGPDYMAVGDPSTIKVLPWMPGHARIVCNGRVKGEPWPFCSRVALKKQLDNLAKEGLTLYTGIEPEFMLLTRGADGRLKPHDGSDALEKPCYDYKGLSRASLFLDELVTGLRAIGVDVYQIDHEDANGQFEVNFTYSDALTTADNFTLVKMAVSELARKHGMIGTFMPKPFSTRTGSGAHFHLSIGSKEVKNLFQDDNDPQGLALSEMGYFFLGGLLKHARALAAICAPTVNSYKRLVVGRALSGATWAPAYIAYGDNNRTGCVRIPGGRLELRLPDSGCNPYLVTAAVIAAGMDGVRNRLHPGPMNNTNLYEATPPMLKELGIRLLPQTLHEAIIALEQDEVVQEGIGKELAAEYIALKRMEWTEYARHVSDWECERYLEFF